MSLKITPKKTQGVDTINKHKFTNSKAPELAAKHASTIAPHYNDEPNCENIVSHVIGSITYGIVYSVVTVLSFIKYLLNCCCDTDAPIITFEDEEAEEAPKKIEKQVKTPSKETVPQTVEVEPAQNKIPALSHEDRIAIGTVITNLATQGVFTLSSEKTKQELFKLGAPFRTANPISVLSYVLDHKSHKKDSSLSDLVRAIPNRHFGSQIWAECLKLIGAGLAKFKNSPTYEADLKLFAEVYQLKYETLNEFLANNNWDGFLRHIFKM